MTVTLNADKARVYLSPRVERLAHVPDELTPEWVNKNASYVYLAAGDKPIRLSELKKDGTPISVLLHAPLDEAPEPVGPWTLDPPYTHKVIVTAFFGGVTYSFPERFAEDVAESRKNLDAARGK